MPRRITTDIEKAKTYQNVASVVDNGDETITLTFQNNGGTFLLTLSDYPSGDTFYFCTETSESGAITGDLEKIHKELLPKAVKQSSNNNKTEETNNNNNNNNMQEEQSGEMNQEESSTGFGWDRADSYNDHNSNALDPALQRDLDIAKAFGVNATFEKVALGCRLSIPIMINDLIGQSTALAWGVNTSLPLTLQLRFERPEYVRCSRKPEVLVFQNNATCRFGQQVRSFVDGYIHEHWHFDGGWKPPKRQAAAGVQSAEEVNKKREEAISQLSATQRLTFDALQRLGYDDDISTAAAMQAKSKDEAVKMCEDGTVLSSDTSEQDTSQQTSQGWLSQLKKAHDKTYDPKKYVAYDPEEGFIVHLFKYVRHRVPSANRYCVICDKKHLVGASSLKCACCERELCVYRFQQVGLGKDATDSVATGGGVIDLLVSMFRTCVAHARAPDVLNPYPSVADANGKLIFDPKNKDFDKLRLVAKDIPPTKDFVGLDSLEGLAAKLKDKHPATLPLLEWVISSNRSLLVKLRDNQRISRMSTPHQFLLITASEEKQKAFEKRKKDKGTVFGFHGSRIENWHSILRVGLRVLSGTKLQLCGAAHGAGVYFGKDSQTSFGYSQATGIIGAGDTTKKDDSRQYFDGSQEGSYAGLAVCEIVKDAVHDHGWCFTVTDEDAIMTRFFFVYTSANDVQKASNIQAADEKFVEELRALIAAS